jgi:hypothetical protein
VAKLLFPILRPGAPAGSTAQADLLLYAWRDVRGVEAPAAAPPARSGFNAEAEWTERAERAYRKEHDDNGHKGPKFPIGCIWLRIVYVSGPNLVTIRDESTLYGVRHGDVAIGTVDMGGGPAVIGIDLAEPIPKNAAIVSDDEGFGRAWVEDPFRIGIADAQNPGASPMRLRFLIFPE